MFERVVLGVDPGIATAGLAVLGERNRQPVLIWATTVRTAPGLEEVTARASHTAWALKLVEGATSVLLGSSDAIQASRKMIKAEARYLKNIDVSTKKNRRNRF